MHNAQMEQLVQHLDAKFRYSNSILNYDEEMGVLFFMIVFGIATLLLLAGIHFGFATGLLALLVTAGACGWLGWFMTGVPCTFTYVFIGVMVAVPIGIFIALWRNRDSI